MNPSTCHTVAAEIWSASAVLLDRSPAEEFESKETWRAEPIQFSTVDRRLGSIRVDWETNEAGDWCDFGMSADLDSKVLQSILQEKTPDVCGNCALVGLAFDRMIEGVVSPDRKAW